MKLTNEELDVLLAKAGLRLDQEHSPRCSYRKIEWLRAACLACGTQADYRLAYILDKNAIGEKVCRACYWRDWYRGEEDIHYTNGVSLVEAKQRLVAAGLEESPVDMSETESRALARKNGYKLVELLQGRVPGSSFLSSAARTAAGRRWSAWATSASAAPARSRRSRSRGAAPTDALNKKGILAAPPWDRIRTCLN